MSDISKRTEIINNIALRILAYMHADALSKTVELLHRPTGMTHSVRWTKYGSARALITTVTVILTVFRRIPAICIAFYTYFFLNFGSCDRLSWLNCQISSAR